MDLEISGQMYRTGKLNAKQQMHITRKLLPAMMAYGKKGETGSMFDLSPVAEAIAQMSEEDCDFVTDTCLSVCTRQSGSGYQAVMVSGRMLFDDIDMMVMIRLCSEVVKENLSNFLIALPSL